jgi:4-diphosphocytidyl-2C-methyl-D-erythritol kinase
MNERTFSIRLLVISLFLIIGLSLTSCGWKPSEEEIQTLEETRSAALDAEKTQQEKKAEANDLQSQVDRKKAELEKAKAEKAKVDAAVTERHSGDSE